MKTIDLTRPLWVRPQEACRLTGLGLTRIYELLNSGDLESRKLGRARLVSVSSIERLGDDQTPEAA